MEQTNTPYEEMIQSGPGQSDVGWGLEKWVAESGHSVVG